MNKFVFLVLLLVSHSAFSYAKQKAKISELYIHENGSMALKLEGGFTADLNNECPGHNGYAGVKESDALLKSFILAQYAANREIQIGTSGCTSVWIKIVDARGFP